MSVDLINCKYFRINEFDIGVNYSTFSGNEQQKASFY